MSNKRDYQKFARDVLQIQFNDTGLLVTAMTHRSWLNETRRKQGLEHNERLEFLGDAVLELVTTEYLFRNFDEAEGIMTNWRSALVRTESIGHAAREMGFFEMMRMSRGERSAAERAKLQMMANAYEAVVGAIYLDKGYSTAQEFIRRTVLTTLDEILRTGSWQDPKSRLQELAQAAEGATPIYKVLEEVGPDHDKTFTVGAFVNSQLKGEGSGPSKQSAQQAAAEQALDEYLHKPSTNN